MAILPGTRIRDNGVFGTTTDNPLTAGATTFNSARLADLSTVSGNHALVTLDPLRQFGNPEIVMVTAHTAAATVATIQRGMFGTTARSHPVNTLWVHAAADNDYREVVTSGTRPADQYIGQPIFETDTNRLVSFSTGNVWQQDGLFFDPPACRVRSTVVVATTSGTTRTIPFDAEVYDPSGMHDNAVNNDQIKINTAGLYLVTAHFGYAGNNTGFRALEIQVNGNNRISIAWQQAVQGSDTFMSSSVVWKFSVNDFITIIAFQNSGVGLNIQLPVGGENYTAQASATWIGRGN